MDKRHFFILIGMILIVAGAYMAISALGYRLSNPEMTNTQLFLPKEYGIKGYIGTILLCAGILTIHAQRYDANS